MLIGVNSQFTPVSTICGKMSGMSFSDWLNDELQARGWALNELGRRAGVSSAAVSLVMSGQRNAGPEFCTGVAVALDLPPVIVFRKAGLLPPADPETEERREAQYLFSQLIDEDQTTVLTIMRALLGRKRAAGPAKVQADNL